MKGSVPDYGSKLMKAIEDYAHSQRIHWSIWNASFQALPFYEVWVTRSSANSRNHHRPQLYFVEERVVLEGGDLSPL
jgi:phage baseplate assembly protein W